MNEQWVIALKDSERTEWGLTGQTLLRIWSANGSVTDLGTDDFKSLSQLPPSSVAVFDSTPEINGKPGVRKKLIEALSSDARFFVHFGGHNLGQLTREKISELFAKKFGADRARHANPFTGEPHSANYAWCSDIYWVREHLKETAFDVDAVRLRLQGAWAKADLYYSQQAKLNLLREAYPLWLDLHNLRPPGDTDFRSFALRLGTFDARDIEKLVCDFELAVNGSRARKAKLHGMADQERQRAAGPIAQVNGQATVGMFLAWFDELSRAVSGPLGGCGSQGEAVS